MFQGFRFWVLMFNKIYANFKTKVESLQEITTFLSEKIGQKNHFAPHPT
jgi:hypothetical protein